MSELEIIRLLKIPIISNNDQNDNRVICRGRNILTYMGLELYVIAYELILQLPVDERLDYTNLLENINLPRIELARIIWRCVFNGCSDINICY